MSATQSTTTIQHLHPLGSPQVPLRQLCQETNAFFPLLVASNHQVGDQMIKKRHLALASYKRIRKKSKGQLSHLDASLNHSINLQQWPKPCYECNNGLLTKRAFNKVWKNMPSLICNVLPKARLEAMQMSHKTPGRVVQKAYTSPYLRWCLGCTGKRFVRNDLKCVSKHMKQNCYFHFSQVLCAQSMEGYEHSRNFARPRT